MRQPLGPLDVRMPALSPEEAMRLIELLEHLVEALWCRYGLAIEARLDERCQEGLELVGIRSTSPPTPPPPVLDEWPF